MATVTIRFKAVELDVDPTATPTTVTRFGVLYDLIVGGVAVPKVHSSVPTAIHAARLLHALRDLFGPLAVAEGLAMPSNPMPDVSLGDARALAAVLASPLAGNSATGGPPPA